jgi:[ribosomal protein S18]-alanine N-acetyltransferase
MRLERALWDDAPAMAAVHAASFAAPWSVDDIRALMAGFGGFGVVLRAAGDDAILGFALARAVGEEAELLTLAVDPAHRRRGAGQALVEAAALGAAAAGARALFLEVAGDNEAALALYRMAGFARAGARPAYYRRAAGAVDAQILRRDLNSPPA